MKNLEESTQVIKIREKTIQLSFWDIGRDLLQIKESKTYKAKYASMDSFMESEFTFSPRHGWRMMKVADQYKDRADIESVGLTNLYLLLQVPEEQRNEILELVEDKKINQKTLVKQVKRFKSQSGAKPHYSDNKEEHVLKLIRQFEGLKLQHDSYQDIKKDLKESFKSWIEPSRKITDERIKKLVQQANQLLNEI